MIYDIPEVVLHTLYKCSDENDLKCCEKCPYRKWSKEYQGEWKCRQLLMRDAYELMCPKLTELMSNKIRKSDAQDVSEFFKKLVRVNKMALVNAGMSKGELYTWQMGKSTPKLTKFVAVLRACGYDIKIVRRKENE